MDQSWHLYKILIHCYLDTAFCDTALDLWPADNCVNQLVRLSAMLFFKKRIPYGGLLFTNSTLFFFYQHVAMFIKFMNESQSMPVYYVFTI